MLILEAKSAHMVLTETGFSPYSPSVSCQTQVALLYSLHIVSDQSQRDQVFEKTGNLTLDFCAS